MKNTKVTGLLFLLLCFVIQFAFALSNRQFLFLIVIGGALFFIITGLTHSDEIPAEEAKENITQKLHEAVKEFEEISKEQESSKKI